MKDETDDLISINESVEYEFKKLYGFVIAFKTQTLTVNDIIASSSIKPQGIIYKENDEFYFAPLDMVDDIKPIIKEFTEKFLK